VAHTFLNLGFETAEAIPGDAFAWGQSVVSTLIEHANFGFTSASPFDTWEDGWSNSDFLFVFVQTDLQQGQFPSGTVDPLVADGFEYGWNNTTFAFGLGSIDDAEFDAGSITDENFENDWSNNTWSGTLGAIETGLFDAGANANESFVFAEGSVAYTPVLPEVGGFGVGELLIGIEFADQAGGRIAVLPGPETWEDYGFREPGNLVIRPGASAFPGSAGMSGYTTLTGLTLKSDVSLPSWINPGTTIAAIRALSMDQAVLDGGSSSDLDTPEEFDTGAWDAMDTL